MPRYEFHGQTALVTGAARGIGRSIADALAAAGARVFGLDIGDPGDFPYGYLTGDVSQSAAVEKAVSSLPAVPTLLVNNAGITRDRTLGKMSDEEWAAVLSVNLTGVFNLIRAVAPRMAAQGYGRIVNITSINGLRGKFGQGNYAAAKAGLIGLTKTAAREFGRKGVTVNAVAPGMVLTEMARRVPPEVLEQARREAALTELARPEDIAAAVLFLLSDGARSITGEVLRVDAGQYV
jgi:acetoacetyl-CoA reductase/3-oxoacyl-[acyl-carrier protein] reductase